MPPVDPVLAVVLIFIATAGVLLAIAKILDETQPPQA